MYGPQNLTMPGMPGSLAQRRGSPVIVIAPPVDAVVAAVRRQHLVAAGVHAGHADGVLGRLGAAVGEEHHVEVAGRQLGDQPGRLAAGVVGVERGDRAQLVGLLLDRRDELGVLVADVDVDELAGEVEVAVALVVPEPRPVGAGDDDRVERRLRRPRVEDVGAVVDGRPRTGSGSLRRRSRTGRPERSSGAGHGVQGIRYRGRPNRLRIVTAQECAVYRAGRWER